MDTAGLQTGSSGSTRLARNGDIVSLFKRTRRYAGESRDTETLTRQTYRRSADGSRLTVALSGTDRFDRDVRLELQVQSGRVASTLDFEATIMALIDLAPGGAPGAGEASRWLANYLPDPPPAPADPIETLTPLLIRPGDDANAQAVKSAYNALLIGMQQARTGTKSTLATPARPSRMLRISVESPPGQDKVIESSEVEPAADARTRQTLHANGDIDIAFSSTGRVGSQAEHYRRDASGGLTFELVSRSTRTSVSVDADGHCACLSGTSCGTPMHLGGNAPGQIAAELAWERVRWAPGER